MLSAALTSYMIVHAVFEQGGPFYQLSLHELRCTENVLNNYVK